MDNHITNAIENLARGVEAEDSTTRAWASS